MAHDMKFIALHRVSHTGNVALAVSTRILLLFKSQNQKIK